MRPARLTAAYFFQGDFVFRSARTQITGKTPIPLHTHEFAEVFWLENGTGLHLINGARQPLTQGTIVFVRPQIDCHGFRAVRGMAGFTMVNVMLPCARLEAFRQRFYPNATTFFWATTPQPYTVQLTAADLKWLTSWTYLLPSCWSYGDIPDPFLVELLGRLQSKSLSATTAPVWLQQALQTIRQPQYFRGGATALARLAGRTPHHVNRVLRQYYGLTTTAAVNQARMEYAAAELTKSAKKLMEICQECGFQNPSHFHQVFRQHYKTTPHQYRQRQRAGAEA